MILLDSQEILAAIRASLETHVLPFLTDEFAQIQVDAALTALAEVSDRLDNGDPYLAVNARLEAGLADLVNEIRDEAPAVAGQLEAALADAAGADGPREWNRRLGEAVTDVLAGTDPAVARVSQVLATDASLTSVEDSKWMSARAIESLQ